MHSHQFNASNVPSAGLLKPSTNKQSDASDTMSGPLILLPADEFLSSLQPPQNPPDECPLCNDVSQQYVQTPCNHVCCKDCLESWLKAGRVMSNKCPFCRTKLCKPSLYGPVDDFEEQLAGLPGIAGIFSTDEVRDRLDRLHALRLHHPPYHPPYHPPQADQSEDAEGMMASRLNAYNGARAGRLASSLPFQAAQDYATRQPTGNDGFHALPVYRGANLYPPPGRLVFPNQRTERSLAIASPSQAHANQSELEQPRAGRFNPAPPSYESSHSPVVPSRPVSTAGVNTTGRPTVRLPAPGLALGNVGNENNLTPDGNARLAYPAWPIPPPFDWRPQQQVNTSGRNGRAQLPRMPVAPQPQVNMNEDVEGMTATRYGPIPPFHPSSRLPVVHPQPALVSRTPHQANEVTSERQHARQTSSTVENTGDRTRNATRDATRAAVNEEFNQMHDILSRMRDRITRDLEEGVWGRPGQDMSEDLEDHAEFHAHLNRFTDHVRNARNERNGGNETNDGNETNGGNERGRENYDGSSTEPPAR